MDSPGGAGAPLLAASQLSRRFGGRRAVEDLDLEVQPGESLALFGGNGAGKTTLCRLLAGTLRPTSGGVAL